MQFMHSDVRCDNLLQFRIAWEESLNEGLMLGLPVAAGLA